MSGNERALARKMTELRLALGLSQDRMAEVSGLGRTHISKIEGGHNQMSRFGTRERLARFLGVTVAQLAEYLDGDATIGRLLSLSTRDLSHLATQEAAAPAPPVPRDAASAKVAAPDAAPVIARVTDRGSEWEEAIIAALDPRKHTIGDMDVVRAAMRSTRGLRAEFVAPRVAARVLLDAAAALRAEGGPTTPLDIFVRAAFGEALHASAHLNGNGEKELRLLGGEAPAEPVRPHSFAAGAEEKPERVEGDDPTDPKRVKR